MNYSKKALLIILLYSLVTSLLAQNNYRTIFEYLSPLPGAKFIMPEQKISFRFRDNFEISDPSKIDISIYGSCVGEIDGNLKLAPDKETFIYTPTTNFPKNEKVDITIQIPDSSNGMSLSYSIYTSSISLNQRRSTLETIRNTEFSFHKCPNKNLHSDHSEYATINDSLPEGFPEISTTHWNNPSPGYFYISPLAYDVGHYFLIMLDNYQTPVFYREIPMTGAADFKLQPNGLLSYYSYDIWKFIILNTQFEIIDTIEAGNGYTTDVHELRYYEDGHAFLLSYDPQVVDMSQIVEGGQENAIVTGLIVQELDENKDVIFQWRSWDHFEITDASNWIDLTETSIDYVHGNSIEIESDSTMLISCRNMNEITKLNRQTRDVAWRLNGENNMFTLIDWDDDFSGQHSIRMMPDSINYSLFDNGGGHNPQISSAMEFSINEENMTATLLSKFRSDPDIFGSYMGNTQRMLNGNTTNGWGSGIPSVTEFDSVGNILLEYSFPYLNYRAFKFNWNHEVFHATPQAIHIGDTMKNNKTVFFHIHNTYHKPVTINRFINHDTIISLITGLPIEIPVNDSAEFEISINTSEMEVWTDVLTFCWDINNDTLVQRIATQVKLSGDVTGIADKLINMISVLPNPFDNKINIKSGGDLITKILISDITGKTVCFKDNINATNHDHYLDVPSGVYIVNISTAGGSCFTTKIVKQ